MSDAPIEALADLYRRSDGTMRQCNQAAEDFAFCLRKGCHGHGCQRANEILKSLKETPNV